jgi:NAD-dependent DNA ligase
MGLDPHGQPFNIRFNRARRAERDLCEILGMAKGMLGDGVVNESEALQLREWLKGHPDALEQWPVNRIVDRVERVFADGRVDDGEREDLRELLEALVGGRAGMVCGEDASTELPLDQPPPQLWWRGSIFVFTGKFAFGTRADCERQIVTLGGLPERTITRRTRYLIIGTFGSRDWVHTSFGRKIEKAVEYRENGLPLAIVAEEYWAASLPS